MNSEAGSSYSPKFGHIVSPCGAYHKVILFALFMLDILLQSDILNLKNNCITPQLIMLEMFEVFIL